MRNARSRHGGWILAEAIASIVIASTIIFVMTTAQTNASQTNRLLLARQQCIAIAQAQLDSLTATGRPLDADAARQLGPTVTVEFRRRPGQGAWDGLTLVTAVATSPAGAITAKVELSRYVLEGNHSEGVSPTSLESNRSAGVSPASLERAQP